MTASSCCMQALPAPPLRVALLTDRLGAHHFIARELRHRGLQVLVAHSGRELLGWLRDPDDRVDAAIIDLGHEMQNSLCLLREIADEFPTVQRVAITDGSPPLLRRMALRFGRTPLALEQPLDHDSLGQVVQQLERAAAS